MRTCACVILAAVGPVFCAGMDLAELQDSLTAPSESTPVWADALRLEGKRQKVKGKKGAASPVWADALRLAKLYDLIYTLPKPTIVAAQGTAVAGGAGLVTVCDLALAAPEAKFGYPEVRRGLVAAMVMPHLLRHVGERLARYLLLTGELIDARVALQGGLVSEVVPAPCLMDRAYALCLALAEGAPGALAKTKEYLHLFSRQAVSIEEAAKGRARALSRVPGWLAGVFRQEAGALAAKVTRPKIMSAWWRFRNWGSAPHALIVPASPGAMHGTQPLLFPARDGRLLAVSIYFHRRNPTITDRDLEPTSSTRR